MAFDKDAIVEQLSGLTVLELVDLVEALKDKWGVEAAAAMPMGAMMMQAGAGAAAAEEVEEKTEFTVTIKSPGDKKLQVIKEVRAITSLGLKEAKELVESGGVVREDIGKDEADEIREKLEAAGATVEVS
ncbi:MAG: 50S ribosomal protein L7/L12 [Trueperaceae bacterium]|nr:MAG: 50S ribosomal protein L7/L12 [Trueperaceae bacterium]